jgi:hypothetical protein
MGMIYASLEGIKAANVSSAELDVLSGGGIVESSDLIYAVALLILRSHKWHNRAPWSVALGTDPWCPSAHQQYGHFCDLNAS